MKYLLFCLAAALFLGCQSTPGAVKQKLRINFQTDPPTLDPRKGGDMTSSMMHFLLFEGLTRQTPDGPTELGVAKQIDISEDKLTYTFYLREANWSDGTPITAHDFEYTWKTMLNPTFPCFNAHLLFPIKNARAAKLGEIPLDAVGVSAADDKTLVVKLEAPTPYFLDLTAFCALYPVCKTAVENDASWSEGPPHHYACNGPFRLVEWKHCNQLKLEKNPHYWERAKVELEEIKVSLIENEHTALQLFEKGKLDIMGSAYTHIPTDATAKFKQLGLLKDYQVPATTACSFNTTKPPFNNIHLRKALSLAIDREAIVKNITRLSDEPAFTILHPALLSWNPLHMAENVSAAIHFQKGLIELGLKAEDLPVIRVVYANQDLNNKIAQAIQYQWKETFGLKVQLEPSESKVYFNKLMHRDYDVGIFVMRAQYPDPMSILERFKYVDNPKNYPGWYNANFEKILDTQMYADTDEKRAEMLEAAQQIMLQEVPISPIFHWRFAFMYQPYVKNMFISPMGQIVLQWVKILDEKREAA